MDFVNTRMGQMTCESVWKGTSTLASIEAEIKELNKKTTNRFIVVHDKGSGKEIYINTNEIIGFADYQINVTHPVFICRAVADVLVLCKETAAEILAKIYDKGENKNV